LRATAKRLDEKLDELTDLRTQLAEAGERMEWTVEDNAKKAVKLADLQREIERLSLCEGELIALREESRFTIAHAADVLIADAQKRSENWTSHTVIKDGRYSLTIQKEDGLTVDETVTALKADNERLRKHAESYRRRAEKRDHDLDAEIARLREVAKGCHRIGHCDACYAASAL
jgi:hypothetical protein